jgi:hypothetical protein
MSRRRHKGKRKVPGHHSSGTAEVPSRQSNSIS